jgi:hypothetical protein
MQEVVAERLVVLEVRLPMAVVLEQTIVPIITERQIQEEAVEQITTQMPLVLAVQV